MAQGPAPPAMNAPQLLVWEKSPLVLILLMLRVALPILVNVMVTGLLALWMGSLPKLICWGDRATEGASFGLILARKALLLPSAPKYCHW